MAEIALRGRKGTGKIVLVDDSDFDTVSKFKWYLKDNGYAVAYKYENAKGSYIWMHRLILDTPAGFDTDHVNHNKLDNRKENLRICSRSENSMNKGKARNYKYSKYKGVSYTNKASSKSSRDYFYWTANIKVNGKRYSRVGKSEQDAAMKYNELARQYHGEYAMLNII